MKKRIIAAIISSAYATVLTFWGMAISGGGHFNLVTMILIAPGGLGLLFWPLWGYVTAGPVSRAMKLLFVLTVFAHYAGIGWYLSSPDNSDLRRLEGADLLFYPLVLLPLLLYLCGQLFLWFRFFTNDSGATQINGGSTA